MRIPNPFTKKSTITLSKALELKDILQEKLKSNHTAIKLENSVPQGQKRNYDLKSLVKESDKFQEQLIELKLAIQRANLVIPSDEEHCISYYVYLLSEKKTALNNQRSIFRNAIEGTAKNETGKLINYSKPIFTRPEIEDCINKLRKECNVIESKLTTLNSTINVELPFKTNLV